MGKTTSLQGEETGRKEMGVGREEGMEEIN